jgi:hypothetical protein
MSLVAAPAAAQPAPADPPAAPAPGSDEAKAEARLLADKGYEQYEAGQYAKAIQYFRDAEARFHAPTLLAMQAKAQMKNGGLVEARTLFQRVVAEKLANDAPKEFLQAQTEAKAALEDLKGRIATLKVVLKGMQPSQIQLSIDDVEIPTGSILAPIPMNPGQHKVVAMIGGGDSGGRAVFQQVNLKEGSTKTVQFVFRAGGPVAVETPQEGGCASCEVGAPRHGSQAPAAALSALMAGLVMALRRRNRRH